MNQDFIPVPTTIFTGFLGSGKTTIILNLVETLQKQNIQVLYIKNEIGSENIDGQLAKQQNIETKELLNGCICCTLVGPFIHSIDELLIKHRPDRIIIEASGAADPAALALMVSSHPKLARDGVLTIIDVIHFDGYSDLSTTARNQTKFTDLLVFNKVEEVDIGRKQAVVGYVRELNDHSPIVEAKNGKIHPDVVFGVNSPELLSLLSKDTSDHKHHLEEDEIESFHVTISNQVDISKLKKVIENLPDAVYRVKGFVTDKNNKNYLVNRVGKRVSIEPYSSPISQATLVCIGFKIKKIESQIVDSLSKNS